MTSLTGMDVNEMDEEDLENERKKFAEEHGMEAYGKKCPDQFINNLTPMEFDELVVMFNRYDVDGSDTIDKHEARKILYDLGMDHSMEEAEKLFKIIDTDDGGELDFEEFVGFIVMLKKGDSRLSQFSKVMDNLKNTPLGALENQCHARGLKMRFKTLEERPATSQQAGAFVVELIISGHFVSLEDGILVDRFEERKYQGIGETNRAAKGQAASSALIKLQTFLPGIKYKPGDLPEEWTKWANDNLLRGVDVTTILNILVSKGFKPHHNIAMMQRIGAWLALTRFIEKNPDFEESDIAVDIRFQSWVDTVLNRGIDGSILMQVLEDRGLTISVEHPHYAQKIKNNELGIMVDYNGRAPKILDFWQACRDGDVDLVKMYCECLQDVNEEQVGRNDSIARTPLMLAAMENHVDVVKILLNPKYKAHVRHVDRRGRAALHLAAMKGATEACELLLEAGARLYDAEHNGDTALHLAAYMNNPNTVDYLAYKAQEFTRAITSDKVLCRKGSSFAKVVEEVFENLPKMKLTKVETLRFEKTWLMEASILFVKYMDDDVSHYLNSGNKDIERDVLARFDPRPETGINMYNSFTAEWTFVPTIPNAETLGILLGYVFRQSAIDTGNSWMRTPLHLACDGNKVNSHENTIIMLIDVHGASINMKDRYGSSPLHLLWMDRRFDKTVSASQYREEVIFKQREEKLKLLNDELSRVEERIAHARRNKVLLDARDITEKMSDFLWNVVRESCILRNEKYKYEEYVDPDTQSLFYCKIPVNPIRGDLHTEWSWFKPPTAAVPIFNRHQGLQYLVTVSSRWLRTLNGWRMQQCMRTKAIYYYHPSKDIITFKPPRKCDLASLYKIHRPEPEAKYGFGNEWIELFIPAGDQEKKKKELTDENGQIEHCLTTNKAGLLGYKFYRNNSTLHEYMTWDRPVDAVEIPTKMKFCSAMQNKNQPLLQLYYTCEECNRKWAGVLEGKKVPKVILCEPCVFRCHIGHKGLRKVSKEARVSCVCNEVCKATNQLCRAREISPAQLVIQQLGFEERIEWKRLTDRDEKNPYIFCPSPCCWEDGKTPKRWGGWTICRRPPYLGYDSLGTAEADVSTTSVVSAQEDSTVTGLDDDDDGDDDDARSEFTTQSERSRRRAERRAARELKEAQEESEVQLDFFPYLPPRGLPEGWIEVSDFEEQDDSLYPGCRVLAHKHRTHAHCSQAQTPIKEYGTILKKVKPLVYLVQFDDAERRHVGRQYIEAIVRKTFYTNIEKGLCAWTVEEAGELHFHFVNHGVTQNCPLMLDVSDWIFLRDRSVLRRSFEHYDEFEDELSGLIFYIDEMVSMDDRKARIIQRNVRSRLFFPCMFPVTSEIQKMFIGGKENSILKFVNCQPFGGWISPGFSSFIPDEVLEECRILNAWTYIRRRSDFVGEFNSASGEEWEEYVDSISSEYLYWHEDTNTHQWIKPELPKLLLEEDKVVYKVDDEVMFRFPGDWLDTLGVITRIRTDDETNEPMYDVCRAKKYHDKMVRDPNFEPETWIAKHRIKKPVLDHEAAFFLKLDLQLTSNLRRTKAAEERRKKQEKHDKMNEQLAKIRDKLLAQQSEEQIEGQALIAKAEATTMVKKDDKENENQLQVIDEGITNKENAARNMSAAQLLQKARANRAKQEALDVVTEKEKKDQERRKGAVDAVINEKRREGGAEQLTRSEMLALQRTIDMKLKIEDRITERNKIQDELIERQRNRQAKIEETEELLRSQEYQTTTPRSLVRRRLLRRMHLAMDRQMNNYVICEWGCGDWVKRGQDQKEHQMNRCPKRIVSCAFDCGCKLSQEQWFMPVGTIVDDSETIRLREFQAQSNSTNEVAKIIQGKSAYANRVTKPIGEAYGSEMTPEVEAQTFEGMTVQQFHEQLGCRRRLIPCPLNCLEWVVYEELPHHMEETCVKRPAKKIKCRLGCGAEFGGLSEKMIEAEEERHEHEEDQCMYRIIRCAWRFDDGRQCAAQMQAKDRNEHRDYHLSLQGISTYLVAGTYVYNVPKKITRLKVQLWGGGGGGGHFLERKGGFGGGGAFVESIISVEPFDVLEVVVGAGGSCGQHGTEIQIKRKEFEVIAGVIRAGSGADDVEVVEATNGVALGGEPGGGEGCGGGSLWAGGGGGGYSAISKRTMIGNEALAVAGGGGGGGSIDGMPGGNMEGPLPGTRIDRRNGTTATVDAGGEGGDSGSIYNTQWPAHEGEMWQGGKSSQFGGGGGGGYYGGGGGGTSPGVAGGGGGGSSYIHAPRAIDHVIIVGHGEKPGGLKHDPPEAVGLGEWDNLHKPVGHGGYADAEKVEPGCAGCVRIFKPGYY